MKTSEARQIIGDAVRCGQITHEEATIRQASVTRLSRGSRSERKRIAIWVADLGESK